MLIKELRPVNKKGVFEKSEAFQALKRLRGLTFEITHRDKDRGRVEFKIDKFLFEATPDGGSARKTEFKRRIKGTDQTEKISVANYYAQEYKIRLRYPDLPLVQTGKGALFPMELCQVVRFNRYNFKLDPQQTSEMIKFAVQRPPERKREVLNMVQNLDWGRDPYLREFGISIADQPAQVEARVLPNPYVHYAADSMPKNPEQRGRWDLRGVRFRNMPTALRSWALVAVDRSIDNASLVNFGREFKKIWINHGGRVEAEPYIFTPPPNMPHAELVQRAYTATGQHNKQTPQIIFFILREKSTFLYERLKKNAECRFAIPTQMIQAFQARKANAQYISNVCLKVNAKLGGQNCRVTPHMSKEHTPMFKAPTMMIGVDVSHGGHTSGTGAPSIAAMCVSMDRDAAIYSAAVQTNGWGVEIVQPHNMHSMLAPILSRWARKHNRAPDHVFYLRDGVSEGQFAHVMEWELRTLRTVFEQYMKAKPKITVIICTKSHHIRFFPERGDRNGNPLPGTLVEREVTHPFHYDFYLCSHAAIQGTARPVHYNVIHDEVKMDPAELQRLLYNQCYQYCRSTTPVSLHPAVYYAHLAAGRGVAHIDQDLPPAGQTEQQSTTVDNNPMSLPVLKRGMMAKSDSKTTKTSSSDDTSSLPRPLIKPGQRGGRADAIMAFENSMWWV